MHHIRPRRCIKTNLLHMHNWIIGNSQHNRIVVNSQHGHSYVTTWTTNWAAARGATSSRCWCRHWPAVPPPTTTHQPPAPSPHQPSRPRIAPTHSPRIPHAFPTHSHALLAHAFPALLPTHSHAFPRIPAHSHASPRTPTHPKKHTHSPIKSDPQPVQSAVPAPSGHQAPAIHKL
jgi:hypothetical protein